MLQGAKGSSQLGSSGNTWGAEISGKGSPKPLSIIPGRIWPMTLAWATGLGAVLWVLAKQKFTAASG